jgi:ABC-type enterobactin transport system permease subunit
MLRIVAHIRCENGLALFVGFLLGAGLFLAVGVQDSKISLQSQQRVGLFHVSCIGIFRILPTFWLNPPIPAPLF